MIDKLPNPFIITPPKPPRKPRKPKSPAVIILKEAE
jgi:hypothetical protein